MPTASSKSMTAAEVLADIEAGRITRNYFPPLPRPMSSLDLALAWSAAQGHKVAVAELINQADPKVFKNLALRMAADQGHDDIVRILVPISDHRIDKGAALICAAASGKASTVLLLLPHTVGAKNVVEALKTAARLGRLAAVKALIPACLVKNKLPIDLALLHASSAGHTEVVDALLAVTDVPAESDLNVHLYYGAVTNAAINGHLDIVRRLVDKGVHDDGVAMAIRTVAAHSEKPRTIHFNVLEYLASKCKTLPELLAINAQKFDVRAFNLLQAVVDKDDLNGTTADLATATPKIKLG